MRAYRYDLIDVEADRRLRGNDPPPGSGVRRRSSPSGARSCRTSGRTNLSFRREAQHRPDVLEPALDPRHGAEPEPAELPPSLAAQARRTRHRGHVVWWAGCERILAGGAFCASSWLLLPWLEILTRIRKLTLPPEKDLRHKSPPNAEIFPALHDLTEEMEGESFEHVEDAGWDWDDYNQFFRLFYKPVDRTQAAICLIDQHDVAFFYMSISSRAKDGRIWTTWNYPFSYSLQLVPQWRVNRLRGDQTFLEIYESHKSSQSNRVSR